MRARATDDRASVRLAIVSDSAVAPLGAVQAVPSQRDQLLLATWLSPSFPVGGFSYSHGLETVIADRTLADATALEGWIGLLMARGSAWSDAVVLTEAWQAASELDEARLACVVELAEAMAPSRERQLETLNLGAAFLRAVLAGWPHDGFRNLAEKSAYPVAVGAVAAVHRVPLGPTLAAFLNNFAANLVSVAVRLVPLGQTEGLEVLGRLQPVALEIAERAVTTSLDQLGSAAILSDIASARHETLYSRIFRS